MAKGIIVASAFGIGSTSQQVMVKGEQYLVALKNVVVPVGDEILHDDIELAGVGEGKARLFQQLLLSVTAAPPNGAEVWMTNFSGRR